MHGADGASATVTEPARIGDDRDPVDEAKRTILEAEQRELEAANTDLKAFLAKHPGVSLQARLTSEDGGRTVFGLVVLVKS